MKITQISPWRIENIEEKEFLEMCKNTEICILTEEDLA